MISGEGGGVCWCVIASGHVTLFSTQLWISQQPQAVNPTRMRPCLGVTPQRHGDRLQRRLLSSAVAACQEQYLDHARPAGVLLRPLDVYIYKS
jgi:hypothetical protein